MGLLDQLDISPEEFDAMPEEERQRLINEGTQHQIKLLADKQMAANEMLQQDDADIRRRVDAVQSSLLGQDANACTDEPYKDETMQIPNVRSLGDTVINIGDNAIKQMQAVNTGDQSQPEPVKEPPKQEPPKQEKPPEPPKRGLPLWSLPLIGAALFAGGAVLNSFLTPDPDSGSYNIRALPFDPTINPFNQE